MVDISKFLGKDIADLSKLFGVEKANLSQVMSLGIPAAGPSWHSYYTWNTYWEPGYVSCWDPTIPVIGSWSGCTGDYIEVKGTWADGIRPTKFRIIHDGPDDNLEGLRNISLHESDYSYLATAAPIYKWETPPWGPDTTYGYNSGTDIPITWGTNDMFRLNIESYNTGAGWQIAITDYQFYF